jgi:SAM-dependent methyltransferase
LVAELIDNAGGIALDLGCGEGQVMRCLGSGVVGTDISLQLLRHAQRAGPVVRSRLPSLDWVRAATIDVAYAVLVLEHLPDLDLFASAARAVRPGGRLVVVMNHPAFTPATSGPIMDAADGEILWRWGDYFKPAPVALPAADREVVFYHRPLGDLLNAAAAARWSLDKLVERGLSQAAITAVPDYAGQEQMPRLLGVRWLRTD